LLELFWSDCKHLVDGIANADLTEVVATVMLNEFENSFSVARLNWKKMN
jgi:hypothetical protein